MRNITLEQAADLLEIMDINQTIDGGATITHHGHIEGKPTIVISTPPGRRRLLRSTNVTQPGMTKGRRAQPLPALLTLQDKLLT
jgi:hypothetical protein